jgi:phosphoribosyl-ATP pyrophosphohydrolase/phosphoribosyl-AMP cyclohydrolase
VRDRNAPLSEADLGGLAWDKMDGMLPAAAQDRRTGRLLMLGYMDREALAATLRDGFATFFSRSRQRLWQKGETSGNRLGVSAVYEDCDGDALLVLCDAVGPTCHLGTTSCFGAPTLAGPAWLAELSAIVAERAVSSEGKSYTRQLLAEGIPKIAQKIGEEGVELALAAVSRDGEGCAEEAADLLYHLAVLMEAKSFGWNEVIAVLRQRQSA